MFFKEDLTNNLFKNSEIDQVRIIDRQDLGNLENPEKMGRMGKMERMGKMGRTGNLEEVKTLAVLW